MAIIVAPDIRGASDVPAADWRQDADPRRSVDWSSKRRSVQEVEYSEYPDRSLDKLGAPVGRISIRL